MNTKAGHSNSQDTTSEDLEPEESHRRRESSQCSNYREKRGSDRSTESLEQSTQEVELGRRDIAREAENPQGMRSGRSDSVITINSDDPILDENQLDKGTVSYPSSTPNSGGQERGVADQADPELVQRILQTQNEKV